MVNLCTPEQNGTREEKKHTRKHTLSAEMVKGRREKKITCRMKFQQHESTVQRDRSRRESVYETIVMGSISNEICGMDQ